MQSSFSRLILRQDSVTGVYYLYSALTDWRPINTLAGQAIQAFSMATAEADAYFDSLHGKTMSREAAEFFTSQYKKLCDKRIETFKAAMKHANEIWISHTGMSLN